MARRLGTPAVGHRPRDFAERAGVAEASKDTAGPGAGTAGGLQGSVQADLGYSQGLAEGECQ